MRSRSPRITFTPTFTDCPISACRIIGRGLQDRRWPAEYRSTPRLAAHFRLSAATATLSMATPIATSIRANRISRPSRRSEDHPRPHSQRQDSRLADAAELHRHDSGIAHRNQSNPALWTITANPQSRRQQTDVTANQSEAKYTFDTYNWKHTAVAGVEISREISSIDSYTGLTSELVTAGSPFNGAGSQSGVNALNPQFTNASFGTTPTLSGRPTKIAIDTTSGYLMDSANYRDLLILNGGFASMTTTSKPAVGARRGAASGCIRLASCRLPDADFNLGLTLKPLPITAVYVAYATSSNPVGAEFGRYQCCLWRNCAEPQRRFEPDIRTAEEHGDRSRQ